MIKLYLGCGTIDKHDDGYINIDIREGKHIDVVADLNKPLPYDNDSVDEILAESILEHIPHNLENVPSWFKMSKTILVLSNWRNGLKVGGKLLIKVPNFEAIANYYVEKKISPLDLIGYVCGNGEHKYNYHFALFDVGIMGACLRGAGFKDFKFVDPQKYIEELNRKNSWEMGVVATK